MPEKFIDLSGSTYEEIQKDLSWCNKILFKHEVYNDTWNRYKNGSEMDKEKSHRLFQICVHNSYFIGHLRLGANPTNS